MMGSIPRVDRDVTFHDYIPGQPIPILVRDRRTGKVVVNELKRYVKPFTLVTEPAEITLNPAGGEDSISDPIVMPIDNKGHFEIMQAFFHSEQPEGFTVQLFDPEFRPILMNREVHVATIASGSGVTTNTGTFGIESSGGRPFIWPESFWMNVWQKGKAIIAQFRNLSGSENRIRFALHGLRWYHLQAPKHIQDRMHQIYLARPRTFPYFYTTENEVLLPAEGSGEFQTRFTDEAWTEVTKLMSVQTSPFLCRIRETATSKRFMEQPLRNELVFGNGEFPFLCWESNMFEPNFKLTFELENTSISIANTIWITMATRKILIDPREDRLARP